MEEFFDHEILVQRRGALTVIRVQGSQIVFILLKGGLHELLKFLIVIQDVRYVNKGGLIQAYVHKGGLHPWKYAKYPAFVNVACYVTHRRSFDEELLEDAIFHKGNACFVF